MNAHSPEDTTQRHRSTQLNVALAVFAACLLGLSFPPSPFYSLAYVSFVPFFFLVERLNTYGSLTRYSYLFLLVFHCLTLYWTGGFTHMRDTYLMVAGGLLLIFHPLFYLPSILLSLFIRKRFGLAWGLAGFVLLWVAFEYVHSLGEFSFPWLTIGNSQAYDVYRIQIAEYTSTYGLSFLILAFNVVAFIWVRYTTSNRWSFRSWQSALSLLTLLLVYLIPWNYGRIVCREYSTPDTPASFRIGLIQPNVDPFEKWGAGGATDPIGYQMGIHLNETRQLAKDSADLVLWSETAIPFRILSNASRPYWMATKAALDTIGVPVLSGFPYSETFDSLHASATAKRIGATNLYSEDYNAVMLIVPRQPVHEIYKKIKLVPFAERIPNAETFRFLVEPLKWGVGISGWGLGKDTVVFDVESRRGIKDTFAGMICYESVFPDFVRQFVLRGAEFLVILTNDSWWGNTSGTYQHIGIASLRAVENRRWVVQCANGGISGFVDPSGAIHQATTMYTSATAWRDIEPRNDLTYYARHGDVFALGCLIAAGTLVVVTMISYLSSKRKAL